MAKVIRGVADLWIGLGRSPFLADVDERRREPARILAAILGGALVGFTAAVAAEILLGALYTLASGRGSEGVAGLEHSLSLAQTGGPSGLPPALPGLLIAVGVNSLFAVGFVAFAALLARRPMHAYLTAAPSLRWRLFGIGLLLSLLALAPLAAADRYLEGGGAGPMPTIAPGWPPWLAYGAGALLLVPLAAAEELIFRGWLLRQAAAFTRRPVVLIGVTALLFSAAHLDFTVDGFLTRTLMGAGFAYMTLRTGGLELACAAHAANNVAIFLVFQPSAPVAAGADPGLSVQALVFDAALAAGYVVVTESLARVGALRRWAGVQEGELSPRS